MRRTRLSWIAMATIALVSAMVGGDAQAFTFRDPLASQAAPSGQFSGVILAGGQRVFAGSEVNPSSFALTATLYTTSGNPGAPVTQTSLGLSGNDSVAITVTEKPGGGYWATATENLVSFEARSYIFSSNALGSPVPVIGPAPAYDPDIALNAINRDGVAVGTLGVSTPVISTPAGVVSVLPYPHAAVLLGVDSTGTQLAGAAEPSPGADMVATIFNAGGSVVYQDDEPGLIWDIDGLYAVGERNGNAAYWERTGSVWLPSYVKTQAGLNVPGALFTIDHRGYGLGGGVRDVGRPILIDLPTLSWFEFEGHLGVPVGTLWRVLGIDVVPDTGQVAIAIEATDFSGWDMTATVEARPVPEPRSIMMLSAGVAALFVLARHRAHVRRSGTPRGETCSPEP
jgi:hypothetical protein